MNDDVSQPRTTNPETQGTFAKVLAYCVDHSGGMSKESSTVDEHLDAQQHCALFTALPIFEM